jgi:hypothetical protein
MKKWILEINKLWTIRMEVSDYLKNLVESMLQRLAEVIEREPPQSTRLVSSYQTLLEIILDVYPPLSAFFSKWVSVSRPLII